MIDKRNFKLEFNENNMFRIIYENILLPNVIGEWNSYTGIASIIVEGKKYIAVTQYYSDIKPETLFEISEIIELTQDNIIEL